MDMVGVCVGTTQGVEAGVMRARADPLLLLFISTAKTWCGVTGGVGLVSGDPATTAATA